MKQIVNNDAFNDEVIRRVYDFFHNSAIDGRYQVGRAIDSFCTWHLEDNAILKLKIMLWSAIHNNGYTYSLKSDYGRIRCNVEYLKEAYKALLQSEAESLKSIYGDLYSYVGNV